MSRIPIRIRSYSKFHAQRTDGYASKAEAKRAGELKLLAQLGKICDLREQPRFLLIEKDDLGRAVHYVADFSYIDRTQQPGMFVIEDVKGMRTPVYKLKRRMLFDRYGYKITEVSK